MKINKLMNMSVCYINIYVNACMYHMSRLQYYFGEDQIALALAKNIKKMDGCPLIYYYIDTTHFTLKQKNTD